MIPAQHLHRIAITAFIVLLGWVVAWLFWFDRPAPALLFVLLIVWIGPLVATLRGVLHGRRYPMLWSSLAVLICFIHGFTYAAAPGPARLLGVVEIALALTYFTAALLFVRAAALEQREPDAQKGS